MAERKTVVVNPTFRLDVDGKLFKEKADNMDIQDTLVFNDLFTRLSIAKGDLPLFPDLGLKQHLFNFGFVEKNELEGYIDDFENDMENQLGRNCVIDYKLDPDTKSVDMTIGIEGFKYPVLFKYIQHNHSIRVIHYEMKE